MSLLTYADARPWAEAIKEEVLSERMPPWGVEDGVPLAGERRLTARELDRIADWATGGAPERLADAIASPDAPAENAESSAPPARKQPPPLARTLAVTLEHTMTAGEKEEVVTRTLPVPPGTDRWIGGVSLDPGNRAIVHDATVEIVSTSLVEPLLAWTIDSPPVRYPEGSGRRLPDAVALRVTMRYRRPWHLEETTPSARSVVVLELLDAPPERRVASVAVALREDGVSQRVPVSGELLAITPVPEKDGARLHVALGGVTLLATRHLDVGWPIRYRLEEPLPITGDMGLLAKGESLASVWLELVVPGK